MNEFNSVAERLISAVMNEMFDENGRFTLAIPEEAGALCHYCAVMCIEP